MLVRLFALVLITVLTLVPASAQDEREIVVFAAASLADAFTEIGADFEAANPGVRVLFSFGGSSDLAVQLTQGAPADVFASANLRQMKVAQDGGRVGGVPQAFALNRLALITPADNPAGVISVADLAAPGLALVVAAPGVPIRAYTDAMVEKLAADPAYGAGYAESVYANIVSEEQNVRLVAAKVSLGEADAGIVYVSDVTPDIAASVRVFPIPPAADALAVYPISATDDSTNPDLARAFVDYVLSDDGQATLARWNFGRVR